MFQTTMVENLFHSDIKIFSWHKYWKHTSLSLYTDSNLSSKPPKLKNCCYATMNSYSSYTTPPFNKSKQTHKHCGCVMQYCNIKSYFMQCSISTYCVKSLSQDRNPEQGSFVQTWTSLKGSSLKPSGKTQGSIRKRPPLSLILQPVPWQLTLFVWKYRASKFTQTHRWVWAIIAGGLLQKSRGFWQKGLSKVSVITRKDRSPHGAHDIPITRKTAQSKLFSSHNSCYKTKTRTRV